MIVMIIMIYTLVIKNILDMVTVITFIYSIPTESYVVVPNAQRVFKVLIFHSFYNATTK